MTKDEFQKKIMNCGYEVSPGQRVIEPAAIVWLLQEAIEFLLPTNEEEHMKNLGYVIAYVDQGKTYWKKK